MNLTEGQWQIIIAIIAILVAIVLGVRQVAKRKLTQNQRVDGNGVGIQSGRDTNIGK